MGFNGLWTEIDSFTLVDRYLGNFQRAKLIINCKIKGKEIMN